MKLQVLIIFTSVLVAQYASRRVRLPDPAGGGEADDGGVALRSTLEDERICLVLHEDADTRVSCPHRLTRSRFNSNPFGLRFGKRRGTRPPTRPPTGHTLPLLLIVRELEEVA